MHRTAIVFFQTGLAIKSAFVIALLANRAIFIAIATAAAVHENGM